MCQPALLCPAALEERLPAKQLHLGPGRRDPPQAPPQQAKAPHVDRANQCSDAPRPLPHFVEVAASPDPRARLQPTPPNPAAALCPAAPCGALHVCHISRGALQTWAARRPGSAQCASLASYLTVWSKSGCTGAKPSTKSAVNCWANTQ
jgi:hypothetical protein